jgi:hypothetical protein
MATNYPHYALSADVSRTRIDTAHGDEGVGSRFGVLHRVRQILCGLHGHDTLLQFEQDRMFLKCVSCGHESPGWELNEAPPRLSMLGDARRQHLARAHLADTRRIA